MQQAFWNDFLSILEAFWGPFLHDFWKLLDTGCQVKNVQKLLVFVHFRGSGASVRRSKFDVFWKSFWTLLLEAFWEAFWRPKWSQMEAKMGQKSDQKSRRILKTILDGAGRGQNTPGPSRTQNLRGRWRDWPGPWFLFSQLWKPSGAPTRPAHCVPQWAANCPAGQPRHRARMWIIEGTMQNRQSLQIMYSVLSLGSI